MMKCNIAKHFKGKTYLKDIHYDIPELNAFKDKEDLIFIPSCIQSLDRRFKNCFEKEDENGETIGMEFTPDKAEPFIESWGIEIRPCEFASNGIKTSIFFKTMVHESLKEYDDVLIKYCTNTLSVIKDNLNTLIENGLEDEYKSSIDKEFIYDILSKMIIGFKGE